MSAAPAPACVSHVASRPIIHVRLDPAYAERSTLDALIAGQFTAQGETHAIGPEIDWRYNPSADIEWLIILNKFYHAPALVDAWIATRDRRYLDAWKTQLSSWIDTMEPGFIAADVTGRRLQNWVYALSLWAGDGSDIDPEFQARVENSLAMQASWLRENLHPARNHRTLELLALLLVALWLDDHAAIFWSIGALADNAAADFLPDGAHVELSSHYHCLALRNLIDAVDLATDNLVRVPPRLSEIVARARRFAHALHKPDGMIPALSDADVGDYRAMLGPTPALQPCEVFADAGYIILRDSAALAGDRNGQYLVFDCGPIGAGNHGHLDCLSFELAAFGRSLIVDPGRYTYFEGGPVNWRAAFRATAAHNVVQVDGREQTAYRQGPKRMKIGGPAPDTTLLHADANRVHAQATSHEYDVVNERIIIRGAAGWWLVHDRLTAGTPHHYDLRFQLSPDAQDRLHAVTLPDGLSGWLSPNLLIVPLVSHDPACAVEQGWVAPQYGQRHAAPRLRIAQNAANGWFSTVLLPIDDAIPPVSFTCDGARYHVQVGAHAPEHGVLPC